MRNNSSAADVDFAMDDENFSCLPPMKQQPVRFLCLSVIEIKLIYVLYIIFQSVVLLFR